MAFLWGRSVVELGVCGPEMSYRQCRKLAKLRHRAGLYDCVTLACYRRVWFELRQPDDLLAYLSFRRDLGYPLNSHGTAALVGVLDRLSVQNGLAALNLLAEAGANLLKMPPFPWLVRQIVDRELYLSPPLANWLVGQLQPTRSVSGYALGLALVETEQLVWRARFKDFLRENGRICVVGNAGTLVGSARGDWIDSHACVIRFNQFASTLSRAVDIGTRTDVWVRAPGFSPDRIDFSGDWIVASGPDLRFRLTNWRHMNLWLQQGRPVLTVPISVWRHLVAHLHAPPSAGLLILAWLRELLGSLEGVSWTGFSIATEKNMRYHHALPGHTAVNRHQWEREKMLLAQWGGLDAA